LSCFNKKIIFLEQYSKFPDISLISSFWTLLELLIKIQWVFCRGLFPKKMCSFCCAYLIRIKKRNNFVLFSLRKFNFLQQKWSILFLPSLTLSYEKIERKEKGTTVFVESSNWVLSKKNWIELINFRLQSYFFVRYESNKRKKTSTFFKL
jgi:hypothetical protein